MDVSELVDRVSGFFRRPFEGPNGARRADNGALFTPAPDKANVFQHQCLRVVEVGGLFRGNRISVSSRGCLRQIELLSPTRVLRFSLGGIARGAYGRSEQKGGARLLHPAMTGVSAGVRVVIDHIQSRERWGGDPTPQTMNPPVDGAGRSPSLFGGCCSEERGTRRLRSLYS